MASSNRTCVTYKANMQKWTQWGHKGDRVQGMIPTPMVLRKDSNLGPSSGLVNMFAFWLSVLINSRHIIFSSTKSLMKWYRISICFDFECWTGFFDKFMALVLSQNTHIVSWVIPQSCKSFLIHNSCAQQLPAAIYSTLAVERETEFWFLLIHETKLFPR